MKDKLLNTFSNESNGEIIRVNFLETEKGLVIDINGNSMDVFINGENFFSKYDKEEYKYIPNHIRNFVSSRLPSYSDIKKEAGHIECDLSIEGRDYFTKISTQRAKDNNIVFVEYLSEYELVEENTDKKIPKAKETYNQLLKDIENIGYKLESSHAGNDDYSWYQLIVPINKFEETRVIECIKLWEQYNKWLDGFSK